MIFPHNHFMFVSCAEISLLRRSDLSFFFSCIPPVMLCILSVSFSVPVSQGLSFLVVIFIVDRQLLSS